MPDIGKGASEDDLPNMANPDPTGTTDSDGAAANPTATSVIKFDSSKTFSQIDDSLIPAYQHLDERRVIDLKEGLRDKQFYWNRVDTSTLTLGNVSIYVNDDAGKDLTSILTLEEEPRDDGISLNLRLFDETDSEAEKLLVENLAAPDALKFLALRVDWTRNDEEGHSISPYFAVIDGRTEDLGEGAENLGLIADIYEQLDEQYMWSIDGRDGEDKADGESDSGADKEEDDDDNTGGAEAGGEEEPAVPSDGDDDNGDGGGSTLSTGAIAGIAVGGAVVLIAIGVLIWFVLRRRRRNKGKGRTELSQSPNPSNHYIGSKEANDGDLNSPYSEDANITQQTPLDPNAPRVRATESPASFTPYQDVGTNQNNLARTGTNTSVSTHSNSPVESRTRGLPERSDTAMSANQNVAHLVEDGMTADDIRRLEEEEAQLDFEIERAGRR